MKFKFLIFLLVSPIIITKASDNQVNPKDVVKLHQVLSNDNQYYTLLLQFNTLGHRLISKQDALPERTGFKSLDTLNEEFGAKLSYEQVRHQLRIAFNAALLAKQGKTYYDLLDVYYHAKGEGKYWKLQDPRMQPISSYAKKVWIVLTPKATQVYQEFKQSHDMPLLTGIENLDELNSIHRGVITRSFFTGRNANATLVVEFEQAVQESVINEYRSLDEVAKIEND